MGNQFVWNKRYNLGVELIDKEHQKLFRILNKLFDLGQQEEKSHWVCQEAVKYFKDHTLQHFADEEDYMASINYAGLKMHKHIHNNFRKRTLPALERELQLTNYSRNSIHHFLGVCAGWLVGHTLIEDQMIVNGDTIKQWENLLPEQEQAEMGQTIMHLLYTMLQVDSQLISDCYGGEKFGNGIYYHLIYSDRDNQKREFFLIFEESLIISTIGESMNIHSEAVTIMLVNAARYLARQLIERIMMHFSSELFSLTEEQLFTYEQFHKAFEKLRPQFSLLFDTGKGYFAYCMNNANLCQRN